MLRRSLLFAALLTCLAVAAAPAAATGSKAHVHSDPGSRSTTVRAGIAQASARTPSQTLPPHWCGQDLGADDTQNGYDNGPHRYHAVYFVPADRPSRLAELGATFQRDAIEASALLERSYGRAIRFDMGTSCGPQYLDITTVRLPQTADELARLSAQPAALYTAIAKSLATVLPAAMSGRDGLTVNYLGWFDGPAPKGVCGQAAFVEDTRRTPANQNNDGGKLALVYRQGDDFCDGDVARHEIAHTLGAAMSAAPNVADGGHVSDALEDTMGAPSAPSLGGGDLHGDYFDFGNDDYWGELPWWTVDMSRFVCPTADCNLAPEYSGALAGVQAARATPRRVCRRVRTRRGKRVLRCRTIAKKTTTAKRRV